MKRRPLMHSYARIVFVLGSPLSTAVLDPAQDADSNIAKWTCGCQSVGPFRSMVWNSCELHAPFKDCSLGLDEETMLPPTIQKFSHA
jgi:hypothetical protein